jgi:hypothetical protein
MILYLALPCKGPITWAGRIAVRPSIFLLGPS